MNPRANTLPNLVFYPWRPFIVHVLIAFCEYKGSQNTLGLVLCGYSVVWSFAGAPSDVNGLLRDTSTRAFERFRQIQRGRILSSTGELVPSVGRRKRNELEVGGDRFVLAPC